MTEKIRFTMKLMVGVFLVSAVLLIAGCQYQQVQSSPLPSPAARVAIPAFINKTTKEDLDEILTGEIVDEFMLRTSLQLVPEKNAEFVLRGEIVQYFKEPISEVATTPSKYRIVIEIVAMLFSVEGDSVTWKEELRESTVYSILQVGSLQTEQEAIREVCGKLGEDLVQLTLEGWKS